MASFTEAVKSYIEADRAFINTAIPAKVLAYDPVNQKCVVVPLIKTLLKDGTTRDFSKSPMEEVPVMFPSSSTSMITFPLKEGDTVLLVFSQRSIDSWLFSTGTELVDPLDFRKHDIADAIAIPGLFSFPRAINNPKKHTLVHDTDDLVIAHNIGTDNENEFRLKKDGSIEVTAPTITFKGNVNVTGTLTATDDVIGGGKSVKNHTHSTTTDGMDTGAPI